MLAEQDLITLRNIKEKGGLKKLEEQKPTKSH